MSEHSTTHPSVILSATFTVDPVERVLSFLSERVEAPLTPAFSPFGQVFQELLDPASLLRRETRAGPVLCIRWSDLADGALPETEIAAALADAIESANFAQPFLALLAPSPDIETGELDCFLKSRFASDNRATIINLADVFSQYGVLDPFDPLADRGGAIPYTEEAFAALGATIARWRLAQMRKPIKLIAVDCDNTLWTGVVGEDGVDGLVIDAGRRALQREISVQAEAGKIIALLSKNEERDVIDVFSKRPDMALSLDAVMAKKINWSAKSENLQEIFGVFGIGADNVLFIDDSTAECSEMRALAPNVITVQSPSDSVAVPKFVEHLWLFDQPAIYRGRSDAASNVLR